VGSHKLHSPHGLLPAWIASSRVLYLTRFFAEIFAADLQSALWNTAEFFDATWPPESAVAGEGGGSAADEAPASGPALVSLPS